MPGVGGTGVVTVSQVIGTAAQRAGLFVQSLDQTGLAQKGGPVVSDLRITAAAMDNSPKIEAGGVDLNLVFDMIVGVGPLNLQGNDPSRTVGVVSTTLMARGFDVSRRGARLPDPGPLIDELAATLRSDAAVFVDSHAISRSLFGSTAPANILLLGVAFQMGALPIAAEHIEASIDLNGVAVEANIQAFRAGRLYVADRARLDALVVGGDSPTARSSYSDVFDGELGRIVSIRGVDLVGFQNRKVADDYVKFIRRVSEREQSAAPGSTVVAEATARGLYKLIAYKDEYEVARLHLDQSVETAVQAAARGQAVRVSWNLHPPMLRAMGMHSKIRLGPWARPVMRALKAMKVVRGTPLDIFGYAHVRRVERKLVDEYRIVMEQALGALNADNVGAVARLADLPDMVRGYEDIKLASVDDYHAELADLCGQLGIEAPASVFEPTHTSRTTRGNTR